jgi:suppressor of ftsI
MPESLVTDELSNTRKPAGLRMRRVRALAAGIGVTGAALIVAAVLMTGVATGQESFPQPDQMVSADGVLDAVLTVSREEIELDGAPTVATVYNGSFVGPTMRVQPGDRIELELNNTLEEPTNIHFHGLHVSPSGDADNIFLHIEPGATQQYVVELPENHPTGTYWYHSHMHGLSEEQVFGGLSGLLVVDGLADLLPAELRDVQQYEFAIKDFQAAEGAILTQNIDSNAPTTRTVNGVVNPALSIDAGETQLWSFANVGADIYYELQLDGHPFHVLAEDGNPVWEVKAFDSLVMPPGKRFDMLVQGGEPGTIELKSLAYDQQGDMYPEATLATVTVNESSQTLSALPEQVVAPDDLSTVTVDNTRTMTFAKDQAAGTFTIDGKTFDMNRVDQEAKLGTVEEWTIINDNNQQHPFHIHVDAFQVMSVNGQPYDAVGRQDVVNLPANGGEVVIRIPFEEFTGKFVYHCHILNHEDLGMMAVVEVVE